jgi:iron-sulfur cluster assembly protein
MVTLTETAAERVRDAIEKRGRGLGIRVGVRTTGCSGLAYTLEYVDQDPKELEVYESRGVRVYVDAKSLPYVKGMTMDWQKKGLNEGFEFINSLEKDRCGCGESFRV